MTSPNSESSHANVVATQVLILDQFIKKVKIEIPEAHVVYDEQLSYTSAITAFRKNNVMDNTVQSVYPLFAFKRSVLRYSESGRGRRSKVQRPSNKVDSSNSRVYRFVHGEFDLDFLYITKSMDDLERFEISYLAEDGLSGYREVDVDLSEEFGDASAIWHYFLDPGDLSDMSFEEEGVYYKMVTGSFRVRGEYPILKGTQAHILAIHSRIATFLNDVAANTASLTTTDIISP